MSNALKPDLMTSRELIAEIAEIVARGLIRLRQPKSSPLVADDGDSFLHFSPGESVHAAPIWTVGASR